jgi:hypothetical protein
VVEKSNARAGWSKKSKCPKKIYSQASEAGALSYNRDLFTIRHVRGLINSVGRYGDRVRLF